jgi:hypothetical protein
VAARLTRPAFWNSSRGVVQSPSPSTHREPVLSRPASRRQLPFGQREPSLQHLPSLPFLPTSTVFSRPATASLLRLAADHEVRQVSGVTTSADPARPACPTPLAADIPTSGDALPSKPRRAEPRSTQKPPWQLCDGPTTSPLQSSDLSRPTCTPRRARGPDNTGTALPGDGVGRASRSEPPSPLAQHPSESSPQQQPPRVTALRSPSPFGCLHGLRTRSHTHGTTLDPEDLLHRRVRCSPQRCHWTEPDTPLGFCVRQDPSSVLSPHTSSDESTAGVLPTHPRMPSANRWCSSMWSATSPRPGTGSRSMTSSVSEPLGRPSLPAGQGPEAHYRSSMSSIQL